ncbi:MAG: glutamate--tRNA ligase, partial [Candidatus Moraniibacteriota bacterium]
MDNDKKVRVRFAPSPTGYLHVGGLRSALYNYLFARKNKGVFILKIEDTDRKRFVDGAVESLISSLDWVGLQRDEGVFQSAYVKDDAEIVTNSKNYPGILEVGKFGPYIQSEKLEIYKNYVDQLVEKELAYYCFCDAQRLEKMREAQIVEKKPPMYDRHCLSELSKEEIVKKIENNEPYVIRLKIPKDRIIEFIDAVRGKISINTNTIDDQILMKSDGFPTYHLANIIDDHEMHITHVIRGEEWLPSAPKHILLYESFGWTAPEFAHLPLLLSTDKKKLSKRMGDVAVEDYIKKGY